MAIGYDFAGRDRVKDDPGRASMDALLDDNAMDVSD